VGGKKRRRAYDSVCKATAYVPLPELFVPSSHPCASQAVVLFYKSALVHMKWERKSKYEKILQKMLHMPC